TVIRPKITMSRVERNTGLKYTAFSGAGYASCVHGNTYSLPANSVSNRNTNATGRNATYPSMNRMTLRDHRAVVTRCTATNTVPALEIPAKKSQFVCQARQTRSGATNSPMMNTTRPTANSTASMVLNDLGIGLSDAASTSLGDGTRVACKLTGDAPAWWLSSCQWVSAWSCPEQPRRVGRQHV